MTVREFLIKQLGSEDILTPDGCKLRTIYLGELYLNQEMPELRETDILRIGFHLYEYKEGKLNLLTLSGELTV